MKLPIDTESVKFAAAGPVEPVLDYETRAPKLDVNGMVLSQGSDRCHACRATDIREQLRVSQLLVTVHEAGRVLSISRSKVYELMGKGHLPSVSIGRLRRIRMIDLQNFVTSDESE